jgi:hypothetical protein
MTPQEEEIAKLYAAAMRAQEQGRKLQPPGTGGMTAGMTAGMAPQMSPVHTDQGALAASAARDFSPQEDQLKAQQMMAMQLMQDAQSAPGIIKAGNVSAPGANPLTALAQGLRGYAGARGMIDARRGRQDLQGQKDVSAESAGVLDAVRRKEDVDLKQRGLDATLARNEAQAKASAARQAELERNNKERADVARLRAENEAKGGRGATPKSPKTYFHRDPNMPAIDTISVGTDLIDRATQEPVNDLREKGYVPALSADKLASSMEKFHTKTEKTAQLANKFNAANEVLEKHDIDIFGGEAPLGVFQNVPGLMGGAFRTGADLMSADPKAGELYSAMRDTVNQIVRTEAGLSQTKTEIQNIADVYGLNWYDRPDVLVKAWPRLQHIIAADIKNQVSTTHPHALSVIRQNMEHEGGRDWTRIGVGLEGDMPGKWYENTTKETKERRRDVDRRGRPKKQAVEGISMEKMKALDEEEEELYRQFPHLRPK